MRFKHGCVVSLLGFLTSGATSGMMPWFATAHAKDSPTVDERIHALIESGERRGLENLVQDPALTLQDRPLLRLLADLYETKQARAHFGKYPFKLKEHIVIEPMEWVPSGFMVFNGKSKFVISTDNAGAYALTFINGTSEDIEEVAMLYQLHGVPTPKLLAAYHVRPGEKVVFKPALCSELRRYVAGMFIKGELRSRYPLLGGVVKPSLPKGPHPQLYCLSIWDYRGTDPNNDPNNEPNNDPNNEKHRPPDEGQRQGSEVVKKVGRGFIEIDG